MKEHGLYIIKDELLKIITNLGGDCDIGNGNKRPIYYCIKDNKENGLYWAIPTTDMNHRSNEQKSYYEFCLNRPDSDLRSCYYHC